MAVACLLGRVAKAFPGNEETFKHEKAAEFVVAVLRQLFDDATAEAP